MSSRRPDITVILVTDKVVVRSDFIGHAAQVPKFLNTHQRNPESRLVDEVRRAVDGNRAVGRKVAVLWTGVWNQLVNIPSQSIANVDQHDLTEALKYEVEPLIGIDADHAELGFCEVPSSDSDDSTNSDRRFWVNVVEAEQWRPVRDLLLQKKSRVAVLTHPVAYSSHDNETQISFWDQSVCQVSASGLLAKTNTMTGASDRWIADAGFESLEAAFAAGPTLLSPECSITGPLDSGHEVQDLSDEATLRDWMQQAARNFGLQKGFERPTIRTERPMSDRRRNWLIRSAAILLAGGFCTWHFMWLNAQTESTTKQIVETRKPALEKQKYDSMLQSISGQREIAIRRSREAKDDLQRMRFFFDFQTDRIHVLLTKLVELRTQELVVKEIAVTDLGTLVSGISLDSDAAPLLTNRLRDSVSKLGWQIHPASQQGEMTMTNGGPWTFSILLEDIGPPQMRKEGWKRAVQRPKSDQKVRP